MTHRHAAHAAIRNPADGLLLIAATPEGEAARNNRPVSGLASLDASPSRKVRAHRPGGDATVSFQWLAVFEKPP